MEKIKKYIPFNNIPIIILLCLFDIIIIGIDCEFRNALIIVKRFTEMFFILTCCFMVLSKLKVYINFCITAVGVLSAIAFLLELHCLKSFGFRVNETIVQAILLTNRREALEYLYGYIGIKELILVIQYKDTLIRNKSTDYFSYYNIVRQYHIRDLFESLVYIAIGCIRNRNRNHA